MAKLDTLTDKQYQFVTNYIQNGFNAKQAALKAGYSLSYANVKAPKLIDHPAIKARLQKAYQDVEMKLQKELRISISDKARALLRIIEDVIPLDPTQEPRRDYYKDAIRAISELNKMQGDYAPEKRLSMTVDATKEKLIDARRQYEEY